MEFHLGALLFLVSPCLCVNAKHFFRFLSPFRPDRSSETESESVIGDLVSVSRGEPTREDWRYVFSDIAREISELEIVNELREDCIVCWVDEEGGLHGFHPVDYGSIYDGSVSNRHLESTFAGHCFVGLRRSMKVPSALSEIRRCDLLFLYKLTRGKQRHVLRLRHSFLGARVEVSSMPLPSSEDMIDNSAKVYSQTVIEGFNVHYEPGVFETCPKFRPTFQEDLKYVCLRMIGLLPNIAPDLGLSLTSSERPQVIEAGNGFLGEQGVFLRE